MSTLTRSPSPQGGIPHPAATRGSGNFELYSWFYVRVSGVFLLFLPMLAIEYAGIKANVFRIQFNRGKPRWVVFGIKTVFVLFLIVFVLFLTLSRAASPQIRDGQYVLDNHGQIVRLLSETEYVRLKEWELRMFALAWMGIYLQLAAYWWFPRNPALS